MEMSQNMSVVDSASTENKTQDSNTFFYNPAYEKPARGVYNPPLNREFIGVYVKGIDDQTMYKIIGKDGKVFKAISHQTGVDYIFWLKSEEMIAIWGFAESLPHAVNRIQQRINLILSNDLTYNYNQQFPALVR